MKRTGWRVGLLSMTGLLGVGSGLGAAFGQERPAESLAPIAEEARRAVPTHIGGVFPRLALPGAHRAQGLDSGIAALLSWADRLWVLGFAGPGSEGSGLFEVDADLQWRRNPASVAEAQRSGNRLIHQESGQAFIGPYVIKADGSVRLIPSLKDQPLAATARHLVDPAGLVYHLTASGTLFETQVQSLETRKLAELKEVLNLPGQASVTVHAAAMTQGRLVVALDAGDHGPAGKRPMGRLVQWDGSAWSVVREDQFLDVARIGQGDQGVLYAVGQDQSSTILHVLDQGTWWRYRLPRGTTAGTRGGASAVAPMRVRPIEQGVILLDAAGLFYELPATGPADGSAWIISPLAQHQRSRADLAPWRGLVVLAGVPENGDQGSAQANLWLVNPEQLGAIGKPRGSGAVWWDQPVEEGSVSDPFLMSGFDQKGIHLTHSGKDVATFTIEVDFLGDGTWKTYASIQVFPGVYAHHEFPAGYSAHWVRVRCDTACRATATFIYR